MGSFGSALAEGLAQGGAEVIIIDRNMDVVQKMSNIVLKAVQGDGTELCVLEEAGCQECDTAVVAIGDNIEGSLLTTMNLKELKIPYIVAKAVSDLHARVLERIGTDLVVYPNKERAQRLARSLLTKKVSDYFEISEGVSVVEIAAPAKFVGMNLVETGLRRKYGLTILAIERPNPDTGKVEQIINPVGDDIIEKDDTLLVFGLDEKLKVVM